MTEDKNLRALLVRATKDPVFRTQFLSNPEAVAKENKVTLKPDQLEKIKKTAAFVDSLNDLRLPPGPIYYPMDPVLHAWTLGEMAKIIKYSYIQRIKWILYAPDINQIIGSVIGER